MHLNKCGDKRNFVAATRKGTPMQRVRQRRLMSWFLGLVLSLGLALNWGAPAGANLPDPTIPVVADPGSQGGGGG